MTRAQRNCGLRIANCGLFNPKSAFRNPQCRRGQSTLEYAVIVAVAAAALVAMQFYMKRGVQGKLRDATDQVGEQYRAGKTTSEYVFGTHSKRTEVLNDDGSSTSTLAENETQTRSGSETVDTTGEKTVFEELEATPPAEQPGG